MANYEYKVVSAPTKGRRSRAVRGAEGRFANTLENLMNDMAGDGWEYQRAETLPSEERSGLTSSQTVYRNVLIFRRRRVDDLSAYRPRSLAEPAPATLLLPPADVASHKDAVVLQDPTAEFFAEAPSDPETALETDAGLADILRQRAASLLHTSADSDWEARVIDTASTPDKPLTDEATPAPDAEAHSPVDPDPGTGFTSGARLTPSYVDAPADEPAEDDIDLMEPIRTPHPYRAPS